MGQIQSEKGITMKDVTIAYLLSLKDKANQQNELHIEPSDDFNRGYNMAVKITMNDVILAIMKLEGVEI